MNYLLRSMLFVPAYNEKFLDKAAKSEADAIIFDLEDAVPPAKRQGTPLGNIYLTGRLRESSFLSV